MVGGTIAAIIGGWVTLMAQGRQQEHEKQMAIETFVEERTRQRRATLQERRERAHETILSHM